MNDATPLAQFHERVLALGGVFQALSLVQQVARNGNIDEAPFATTLNSVLQLDAPSTEAVYGGRECLQLGLQAFTQHLDSDARRDLELSRYWIGVLVLERKLAKQPPLLRSLPRVSPRWPTAPSYSVLSTSKSSLAWPISTRPPSARSPRASWSVESPAI